MAARSSMTSLITRVRVMINDVLPAGSGQFFTDDDIQAVMDATRYNIQYLALRPAPTYSGATVSYLNYYADSYTDWEDDLTLWQYRTIPLVPALSENVPGHWTFSTTTLPPVYVTGKSYDLYRSAADLLERLAAKWILAYSFSSDGQSFQRSQAANSCERLAHIYRQKQKIGTSTLTTHYLNTTAAGLSLRATETDYIAKG